MSVNTKDFELPIAGAFFWKRVRLEKIAEDYLDKIIEIAGCVEKGESPDCIESAYNDLSDYYYSVMDSLQKYGLPFWWKDFFNVENELKSLVSQLIIYSNNINFIEKRGLFEKMIEREILILKDIKNFFEVMMSGRKEIESVKESFLNNEKVYSEMLITTSKEQEDSENSVLYFPVVNIFERINRINGNISDSLGKITMGAAV